MRLGCVKTCLPQAPCCPLLGGVISWRDPRRIIPYQESGLEDLYGLYPDCCSMNPELKMDFTEFIEGNWSRFVTRGESETFMSHGSL